MPNGNVHDAATMSVFVTASVTLVMEATGALAEPGAVAAYGLGITTGLLVGPDLDVDRGNASHRRIGRVSKVLKWVWFGLWLLYAKAVPHRHWLSHMPVVGTAIRLGYLMAVSLFLRWLLLQAGVSADVIPIRVEYGIAFFVGLALADFCHWALDRA